MTITGTIEKIMDTQKISDSFSKREFVVKTEGEYPQEILIEFTQDKCGVLEGYQVGQSVDVSINIRGRKWVNPKDNTERWFNTVQGWKIGAASTEAMPDNSDEMPY